jgi:hypothetical protein
MAADDHAMHANMLAKVELLQPLLGRETAIEKRKQAQDEEEQLRRFTRQHQQQQHAHAH